MKRLMLTALLSLSLVSPAVPAAAPAADDAVFVEGARYNAVLSRGANAWRLLPAAGGELRLNVAEHCRAELTLPLGLWLLTRDGQGHPELVAPSATALPPGHDGRVRVVDCDAETAADESALPLPAGLLDWLQQHSGSIYVAQ